MTQNRVQFRFTSISSAAWQWALLTELLACAGRYGRCVTPAIWPRGSYANSIGLTLARLKASKRRWAYTQWSWSIRSLLSPVLNTIGGHKAPGHNPQVRTPCRIRTQCTMSFYVTGKGFWKLNFRTGGRKPPDISPWFRSPLSGGSEPGVMSGGFTSANPEI